MEVLVTRVREEALGIKSFELVHPAGNLLPAFEAGAHLDVHVPDVGVRQYSLCNDPDERHRYVIGVQRDADGRGGSRYLHDRVEEGSRMSISEPRSAFRLVEEAEHHILIAGGVGVTPLKSMMHRLERIGASYDLHLCVRDRCRLPFSQEIESRMSQGNVFIHYDEGLAEKRLNLYKMLERFREGVHAYCCGPASLIESFESATQCWPVESVHLERFSAPVTELPEVKMTEEGGFVLRLVRSGQDVHVAAGCSIADALEEHGIWVETSCRSGLCGACKVAYVSGEVDHQDFILSDSERKVSLAACVSKSKGPLLSIDL